VPGGVYVNHSVNLSQGTKIEVTMLDGTQHSFIVAGSYSQLDGADILDITGGLLIPLELSRELSAPETLRIYAGTDGESATVSAALGRALTDATVLDLNAFAARYNDTYQNLFILALSMSGLAFLAGILLVANSVSLAMLERRYEFGVLKATGYSHAAVLGMLSVEYGVVALVSTFAGLGGVSIFLWVLGKYQPMAVNLLVFSFPSMLTIGLGCIGLIVVTVLGVAWQTTRVSPIVILADRG
jgi:ABC-type antimicrobial peptide transport system permease subunit